MSKVFVNLGMTLDGQIAGPNRGPRNPLGDRGLEIHEWLFQQRAFRELLKLGEGGETGADNKIVEQTFGRIGANVMGKRMFQEGEASWPEEAPFHSPVYVLTREVRAPWERKGGTTFHFVNDGMESALRKARAAAGDKDVRISGGANVVMQYLNAGLVDELQLAIAPMLMGDGLRLFDSLVPRRIELKLIEAIPSAGVTHVRYAVSRAKTGI